LFAGFQLTGESEYQVGVPPWSWMQLSEYVINPEEGSGETLSQRLRADLQWQPASWLTLKAGGRQYNFQEYHSLVYRNPSGISVTDSSVNIQISDEELLAATGTVAIRPAEWFSMGGTSMHILSETNSFAEAWANHSMNGWLHVRRFFFNNNLLAHMFVEGGLFLQRQFTGWNPALQSLTRYPQSNLSLNPTNYIHVQFIGEIGPFTITTSFYNALGTNIAYAVDQRPHSTLFFLGVRWQLWE
jgi:hypothetical protein